MSQCGVFSGPYFPVFSPNTEKHGPEKTPYLDIFVQYTVIVSPKRDNVRRCFSYNKKLTNTSEEYKSRHLMCSVEKSLPIKVIISPYVARIRSKISSMEVQIFLIYSSSPWPPTLACDLRDPRYPRQHSSTPSMLARYPCHSR